MQNKKPKCQYCEKETTNLKIARLKVPDNLCIGAYWLCEDCRENDGTSNLLQKRG